MSRLTAVAIAVLSATFAWGEDPTDIRPPSEARATAYAKYRKEIVALLPITEVYQWNALGALADAGYFPPDELELIDKTGANFTLAPRLLMNAVWELEFAYGTLANENPDENKLKEAIRAATEALQNSSIKNGLQAMIRARRWDTWEEKLRQEGKFPELNENMTSAYKILTRNTPLNLMAALVDTLLVDPESFPELDDLGPQFILGILIGQTNLDEAAREKLDADVHEKCVVVERIWQKILMSLPEAPRWKQWNEAAAKDARWHESTQVDQWIIQRLIDEERAAWIEEKKKEQAEEKKEQEDNEKK